MVFTPERVHSTMKSPAPAQHPVLEVDRSIVDRTLELLPSRRASLREAIAAENRASATNPNVLLGSEISRRLEGSILPADARRAVLRRAEALGIRQFDASLLIAVAQDRARRGETLDETPVPFEPQCVQTLRSNHVEMALWASALLIGTLLALLEVRWLLH